MKRCAALLALSLTAPVGLSVMAAAPVAAQQAQTTSVSPTQATAIAESLLKALEQRDGSKLHATLAEAVQSSISVDQVQQRLEGRPAITGSRVVGVSPGYRTTTVDAVVTTAQGDETLLIVLDDQGQLLAWKWSDRVLPIEQTALDFAEDLAAGRWVIARTRLSLELQQDLAPADLERKWTKLSAVSGGFRKVKNAVVASSGGDQQLVLVAVEFGTATSNLFVIFDERGRITNVDISRDFV